MERLLSGVCASLLAMAVGIALTSTTPSTPIVIESHPRLRDLVTQPAAMILVLLGGGFSTIVALRVWQTKESA